MDLRDTTWTLGIPRPMIDPDTTNAADEGFMQIKLPFV